MAKRDEYTADIEALEDLDEFDEDDEELEPDLGADLDEDLDVALEEEDLGVGRALDDDDDENDETAPDVTPVDEDDEALDEEEEDEGEEALDVLLRTRDSGLDEDFRLDDEPRDGLGNLDAPISAGEFTCRSCFLVKRRPQLADEGRMICFDCL